MKEKLSSMCKTMRNKCSSCIAKIQNFFSKRKSGHYATTSKVKVSDRTTARRPLVHQVSNRHHSFSEWGPAHTVISMFRNLSNYYHSLGRHRLLYVLTACLLLIMTPFSIAFCIPFNSASAGTDVSLHINSSGVLSAAEVEASEPTKIYSAEPGFVNDVVIDIQERLMELSYMGEDEPSNYYGDETVEAIKRFQRTHGLEMTGVADYVTFDLLFSDEAKPYAVTKGAEGEDVLELQLRLVELGYLEEANGIFDDATTSAVELFQQRNALSVDGTIGQKTREALYSDDVNAYALYLGEESSEILSLQQRLSTLGYLTTTPDGKYGQDTVSAVKRFQERNGLISDGYLGNATKQLLLSDSAQANSISLGDSGNDVTRIQERLVALGYMRSATGYFGENTVSALKSFQKRNGLTADGKFGVSTNHKLFSDSAIKAASSSSSNTSNSSNNNSSSSSNNSSSSSSNNNSNYEYSGSGSVSALIKAAESRLGCKYVLGAKGPNQFDCSGLVYWCLNNAGVKQSYMTSSGWRNCSKYQRITSRSQVKAGDILVFTGHVGIAVSNSMMIDASTSNGKVVKRSSYGSYWDSRWICAYRIF